MVKRKFYTHLHLVYISSSFSIFLLLFKKILTTAKQKTRKKSPFRGFLLRRYVVTRYAVTPLRVLITTQLAYDCRVGPKSCRRPVVRLLYATKSYRVNQLLFVDNFYLPITNSCRQLNFSCLWRHLVLLESVVTEIIGTLSNRRFRRRRRRDDR